MAEWRRKRRARWWRPGRAYWWRGMRFLPKPTAPPQSARSAPLPVADRIRKALALFGALVLGCGGERSSGAVHPGPPPPAPEAGMPKAPADAGLSWAASDPVN